MPVEVFHVSTEVYEVGQVVAVPEAGQTRFQDRLEAGAATQAEDRLEVGRPAGAQSRRTTQYAFADVYDCVNYGSSQYPDEALHYYRVSMENPNQVPMALVNVIKTLHNPTDAQVAALVSEYWNPTVPWQVYEYLAPSMTILEMLATPNDPMAPFGAQERMNQSIARAGLVRDAIMAGQPIPAFAAADAQDDQEEEEDDEQMPGGAGGDGAGNAS